MEYILLSLILAAVFAFIAYPILKPAQPERPASDALDTLVAQRDSAYQAIRDLDFDYQLGKLSETDYAPLRDRYKAHAAIVLQQIDAMDRTDADQTAQPRTKKLRCGNCSSPYESNDKFCRRCGNKLD